MALYNIGRNQKTGAEAELEYVRVELFQPHETLENTFYGRKFKVAVAVTGITGAGGEAMKVTGTLHGVGDPVYGTFNTTAKTFTETA
ncbi:MAG TPA: hypothetical protein DDW34_07755 [Clostridium sp.]|nr:hypothetical protein [Clostridium sp.]